MKIKVTKQFLDKENELKPRKVGEELTVTDERAKVLISKGFAETLGNEPEQVQPETEPEQTEAEVKKPAQKKPARKKSAK